MRIGFFADSYRPYTSGVVRSIDTFADQLRNWGHQVYIFAPNYPNHPSEDGVFRFASVPSPTNREFTLAIPISPLLSVRVRDLKLDLIHVHSPFMLGRVGAKIAHRLDLPLVFTYHTLYDRYVHYLPFAKNLSRKVVLRWSVKFCNQCDVILTPTKGISNYIQAAGVSRPIQVLPTGVRLDDMRQADPLWLRNRLGLDPTKRILLYVGRLGEEKNLDFLLRACAPVIANDPSVVLVLAGNGNQQERLRELSHLLAIEQQVFFTGVLSPAEVSHCYAAAELFVFASLTETQGLVLAEAKAAGLPAIALKAFGVSEMITDGVDGRLVNTRNPNKFSEQILSLLHDPSLLRQMHNNAFHEAQALSAENCTSQLLQCYQNLINKRTAWEVPASNY